MTKSYEIRRVINATPERIWARLTDARALVDGGLGVLRLEGEITAGARLKLWSVASPDRAFALTVSEFTRPRTMVWSGGMPLGLFTGVRRFSLTPRGAQTEFHMREEFSGLMAPLIVKSIPDLTPSFEMFAKGLAALAEEHTS